MAQLPPCSTLLSVLPALTCMGWNVGMAPGVAVVAEAATRLTGAPVGCTLEVACTCWTVDEGTTVYWGWLCTCCCTMAVWG